MNKIKKDENTDCTLNESNHTKKVLGLYWDLKKDEIIFYFDELVNEAFTLPMTKRSILKISAKIFDPIGLISPITIQFKMLFQIICTNKFKWDDILPDDILKKWIMLLEKLKTLHKLVIPRGILKNIKENDVLKCEIHGFCDSSLKAYCGIVYLKVFTKEGDFVRLLSSKSKVAPHNLLTIPRLELLGCHLLSKLVDSVKKAIDLVVKVDEIFYWTDSEICLCWIKSINKEWKAWVENRVNKIRALTDIDSWRFVPGECNPSDIGTREKDFVGLQSNALFWNGPSFLLLDQSGWPKPTQSSSEVFDNVENVETHVNISKDVSNRTIFIENLIEIKFFSSLEKLLLVTS